MVRTVWSAKLLLKGIALLEIAQKSEGRRPKKLSLWLCQPKTKTPYILVEGKVVSPRHKHYIHDMSRTQVAYIYQKPIALLPKFFIELLNGKVHEIKGKLAFAHEVNVIEELGWRIRGNFLQHN